MSDIMAILRERFPERESFSRSEIEFAARLMGESVPSSPSGKSRVTPRARFVPVGGTLLRYRRVLRCVERPRGGLPCDACSGCFFSLSESGQSYCDDIQCSKWDRRDGLNVWFQEVR